HVLRSVVAEIENALPSGAAVPLDPGGNGNVFAADYAAGKLQVTVAAIQADRLAFGGVRAAHVRRAAEYRGIVRASAVVGVAGKRVARFERPADDRIDLPELPLLQIRAVAGKLQGVAVGIAGQVLVAVGI